MRRGHVTVAHFVPSVLSLFLDFVSPGDLPALRQISCTGEALLLSHREKVSSKLGRPLSLINLYGPTEASVEVTYFEAVEGAPGVSHGFPIGFPGNQDVKMYVTDANDPTVLVAPGDKGEISIGGIQVAYGYLNRPELSAARFIENPHGHPGLLYRTVSVFFLWHISEKLFGVRFPFPSSSSSSSSSSSCNSNCNSTSTSTSNSNTCARLNAPCQLRATSAFKTKVERSSTTAVPTDKSRWVACASSSERSKP